MKAASLVKEQVEVAIGKAGLAVGLSTETGPIDSLAMLMDAAAYFSLNQRDALQALAEVYAAVVNWRTEARSPAVGLRANELDDFVSAFEHDALYDAQQLLGYK
ncbi:MAG: serine/threonine-protein kinase HipA [Pseudomonadota bacterium]|nr:serine/threonine-protein kinase HipA [Pseudomonadota bacterium]